MRGIQNGSRVWYWGHEGGTTYGVVQSTSVAADGSQIVVIKEEKTGAIVNLPVSGVNKVP
ncbi:hypothetical protein DL96DRAFT_1708640 [Flagelloscypha sp. PMI_526]|nr:hypothetical protein DL96DRAFT_1708640 [Flagelloscypha sp. PMI_526]